MEKSNSSNQSFQVIEDFLNDNFYFKNEKYKTIYESLYIKNKEDINSFVDYLHSLTNHSDLNDLDCFLALFRLFFAFYQKNNVIVDSIIVIDINMANFRTENPFESIEIDLIKDNNESLIFKNKRINKVIFDNITDFTYFSTLEAYKKCFVFKGKDFFDSLGGELLNLKAGSL